MKGFVQAYAQRLLCSSIECPSSQAHLSPSLKIASTLRAVSSMKGKAHEDAEAERRGGGALGGEVTGRAGGLAFGRAFAARGALVAGPNSVNSGGVKGSRCSCCRCSCSPKVAFAKRIDNALPKQIYTDRLDQAKHRLHQADRSRTYRLHQADRTPKDNCFRPRQTPTSRSDGERVEECVLPPPSRFRRAAACEAP